MWQEKQASIILPGQTSFTPKRLQGAQVGNTILPPPSGNFDSDFVGGSSRKRKLIHLDPARSTSECSFPWKSNVQDNSSFLESHGHGINQGIYLNQAMSVGPVNFTHHFDNQVHYQNDFSETRPSFNSNSQRNGNGIEKIVNSSYNVPSQSLKPNENMPIGETNLPPIRQTQSSYVFSQTEGHRSLSLPNASNANTEVSQGGFGFQETMSFGTKNYVMSEKVPREMASSECTGPTGILQQSFEISCEPKESIFCSKKGGINDLQNSRQVLGASDYTEQDEKIRLFENEVLSRSVPYGKCFVDHPETKEGCIAGGNVKLMEITTASDTEKPKLVLAGHISSENKCSHDNTAGHGQNLKSDEKTRLPSEKAACSVTENLWNGSLQLSSSITLSAVAFFKSGEKLLDINWPEFVEVKGKVRLEAFEKYIQDLPRSRNRGLMVISLCWKEGSSETGLNGLKEVARGYIKGARVGFAQLSPGIDLYICPRSDTIITILAKYGFFKGMAVIDDNQDSLIGCVVWKKNRTSSSSVGEKTDSKSSSSSKQPLYNNAEKKFSPIKQAQESSLSAQALFIPSSAALENGSKNGTESKNNESNFLTIPSVLPSNTTPVPMGQQTPNSAHSPLPNINSHPFNLIEQAKPPAEDDDLPEYDFGVACGISLPPMSKSSEPALSDSSENPSLARIPVAINQTRHQLKQISESHIHVVPISEEKHIVSNTSEGSSQDLTKKKKLFDDDDDDMPEWCPPEHHSQSLVETIRPPTTNNVPSRPSLPSIPPPTPTDTRSAFSYQPFRPAFSNPTVRPPQPLPFQSGPGSSMGLGLNPNPASRPEFQFSDRRGQMP